MNVFLFAWPLSNEIGPLIRAVRTACELIRSGVRIILLNG